MKRVNVTISLLKSRPLRISACRVRTAALCSFLRALPALGWLLFSFAFSFGGSFAFSLAAGALGWTCAILTGSDRRGVKPSTLEWSAVALLGGQPFSASPSWRGQHWPCAAETPNTQATNANDAPRRNCISPSLGRLGASGTSKFGTGPSRHASPAVRSLQSGHAY